MAKYDRELSKRLNELLFPFPEEGSEQEQYFLSFLRGECLMVVRDGFPMDVDFVKTKDQAK